MAKKSIIDLDDIPSSKTETKSGNSLVSIGQTIKYSITQEDVRVPPSAPIEKSEDEPAPVIDTNAPVKTWRVVITNMVGTVFSHDDEKPARKAFALWAQRSSWGYGSVGHEKVSLLKDNVEVETYVWQRGVAAPSHFVEDTVDIE